MPMQAEVNGKLVKVLGLSHHSRSDEGDIDEVVKEVFRAVMPRGQAWEYEDIATLSRAVRVSCDCPHDCCGHWFSYTSIDRMSEREVRVTQEFQRNY